jgi:hypothetical protein
LPIRAAGQDVRNLGVAEQADFDKTCLSCETSPNFFVQIRGHTLKERLDGTGLYIQVGVQSDLSREVPVEARRQASRKPAVHPDCALDQVIAPRK